ncbi:MAG: MATE family efflux transporter [Stomatobaculum sp.]|nr:MATE family efflux transporter [Stomatobaculum sp.]
MQARSINMTEGSIGDKLLAVALPLAATAVLQQMFNAADVVVVGRFAGKQAMAAVGSNTPVIGLMVNLFTGISLGTNVVIAKMLGAREETRVHDAVHTSVLISVLGGILLLLAGQMIAEPLLRFLSVPEDVLPSAVLYLRIYALGFPVIFLYNFEAAILRSQGNTQTPLFCLTLSGILNVLLNLLFVIVFKMDVAGVALATVLANVVSSLMLFFYLTREKGLLRVVPADLRLDPAVLKEIVRIGLPAGLQGMLFSISNIMVQSAINSLGSDVMAGSAAAFNVEITAFFIINAYVQALTTFIGQNYGAGKAKRCLQVTRIAFAQGMALTMALTVVLLIFARPLLSIFNSEAAVIEAGLTRMHYILYFEYLDVLMELFPGAMRGYGRSLPPAIISLIGVVGTRVLWVNLVFPMYRTFSALMTVYPVTWIITTTALFIAYMHMKKVDMKDFFAAAA